LGLADAGGTGEQVAADRLLRLAQAGARELDGAGQRLDRLVLAEHQPLQVLSMAASTSASDLEMVLGGIRAMVATVASTSLTVIFFLRLASGTSICEAPVSSITSMALSGSLRSLMYLADSSTAAFTASLVYLSLWYSSKYGLRPFRISM